MFKSKHLLASFCLTALLLAGTALCAQDHDFSNLQKDYPLLMERYGTRLESRNAHYIFAIDISSSMRQYENVVRASLKTFVRAIPDGDQITLIAMCDEDNTNYISAIRCITINPTLRADILREIDSDQFRFLQRGDRKDGSDGFSMAKKVLEAMNVVNSSDLTFIYMLTDFEYWTHKNRFDKTAEDWESLRPLLTEKHKGAMCKYGVELNFGNVSHPEAVIKPELEGIFGIIDYQSAGNANILQEWFGHIIDDIRAQKINNMLKADWQAWQANKNAVIVSKGRQLELQMTNTDPDLVSGFEASGMYEVTEKPTFWPSYITIEPLEIPLRIHYESKYAEEINKLQGLCKESPRSPGAVNLDTEETAVLPDAKIWNSTLPQWLWFGIIGLVALFILSVIIKYMQTPARRITNIVVKRKVSGSSQQLTGDTMSLPYSIGMDGDMPVPGASWRIRIVPKRYNPVFNPFRRTGYYAVLETGDFADIVNDMSDVKLATLSVGKTGFLFKYKKAPMIRIEITEGMTTNIITLS